MESESQKQVARTKLKRKFFGLWIYPKFQGKLIATNILSLTLIFMIIAFLTYRSSKYLELQGVLSNLPVNHPYFQFLHLQYRIFCSYLAVAYLFSVFLTSLSTLLLSHRLAGPIVRLNSFFKNISENGFESEVKFRENDFFLELPIVINAALKKIKSQK